MISFQPPGFVAQSILLPQGKLVYYTQGLSPWSVQALENKPIVLFLHSLGGGSSAYEWSKVYSGLAAQYRIVAPDLIGWGASAHPSVSYGVADYLQILRDLLAAMHTQWGTRPRCVVASSVMAALMVQVAVTNPACCDRLFLVCPSGYRDFGSSDSPGFLAQLTTLPFLDQAIYQIGAANEFAIANFLAQFLFANPQRITEEMIQAYLASALQPQAEYAALSALRGDIFFDLAKTIDRLTIPTTFVWGSQAKFSSPETGRRLQQLNPQAIQQFYEIPDTGVLPHLEQPGVVIALLRSIVDEIS